MISAAVDSRDSVASKMMTMFPTTTAQRWERNKQAPEWMDSSALLLDLADDSSVSCGSCGAARGVNDSVRTWTWDSFDSASALGQYCVSFIIHMPHCADILRSDSDDYEI